MFSTKLLCQKGEGTTILLLTDRDTISIAADSKRTFTKMDGSKQFVSVKKIWNVGEIFFFMAGTTIIVNLDNPKDTVFDAYQIMYSILSIEKDIDNSFKIFNDSIVKRLSWVMKESKNKKKNFERIFFI